MSDFSKPNNWEDHPEIKQDVDWRTASGKEGIAFVAEKGGAAWSIRINDFPDEPLFTLIVGGEEVLHFDDWPHFWVRPELPEMGPEG